MAVCFPDRPSTLLIRPWQKRRSGLLLRNSSFPSAVSLRFCQVELSSPPKARSRSGLQFFTAAQPAVKQELSEEPAARKRQQRKPRTATAFMYFYQSIKDELRGMAGSRLTAASERWRSMTADQQQPYWSKVTEAENLLKEKLRTEMLSSQLRGRDFEETADGTLVIQFLGHGDCEPERQNDCKVFREICEGGAADGPESVAQHCMECKAVYRCANLPLPACPKCNLALMNLRRSEDGYIVSPAFHLPYGTMLADEQHCLGRVPAVLVDGVIDYFMPAWLKKGQLDASAQAVLASAAEEFVSTRFLQSHLLCKHRNKKQVTGDDLTLAGNLNDPAFLLGKLREQQSEAEQEEKDTAAQKWLNKGQDGKVKGSAQDGLRQSNHAFAVQCKRLALLTVTKAGLRCCLCLLSVPLSFACREHP